MEGGGGRGTGSQQTRRRRAVHSAIAVNANRACGDVCRQHVPRRRPGGLLPGRCAAGEPARPSRSPGPALNSGPWPPAEPLGQTAPGQGWRQRGCAGGSGRRAQWRRRMKQGRARTLTRASSDSPIASTSFSSRAAASCCLPGDSGGGGAATWAPSAPSSSPVGCGNAHTSQHQAICARTGSTTDLAAAFPSDDAIIERENSLLGRLASTRGMVGAFAPARMAGRSAVFRHRLTVRMPGGRRRTRVFGAVKGTTHLTRAPPLPGARAAQPACRRTTGAVAAIGGAPSSGACACGAAVCCVLGSAAAAVSRCRATSLASCVCVVPRVGSAACVGLTSRQCRERLATRRSGASRVQRGQPLTTRPSALPPPVPAPPPLHPGHLRVLPAQVPAPHLAGPAPAAWQPAGFWGPARPGATPRLRRPPSPLPRPGRLPGQPAGPGAQLPRLVVPAAGKRAVGAVVCLPLRPAVWRGRRRRL